MEPIGQPAKNTESTNHKPESETIKSLSKIKKYLFFGALGSMLLVVGLYSVLRYTWVLPDARNYLSSLAANREQRNSQTGGRNNVSVFGQWEARTANAKTIPDYLTAVKEIEGLEAVHYQGIDTEALSVHEKTTKKPVANIIRIDQQRQTNRGATTQNTSIPRPKAVFVDGQVPQSDYAYVTCEVDSEGRCKVFVNRQGDIVGLTSDFFLVDTTTTDCTKFGSEGKVKDFCEFIQTITNDTLKTYTQGSNGGLDADDYFDGRAFDGFPKPNNDVDPAVSNSVMVISLEKGALVRPEYDALADAHPEIQYNEDGSINLRKCTIRIFPDWIDRNQKELGKTFTLNEIAEIVLHEMLHCFAIDHSDDSEDIIAAYRDHPGDKIGSMSNTLKNTIKGYKKSQAVTIDAKNCFINYCGENTINESSVEQNGKVRKFTCRCKDGYTLSNNGRCEKTPDPDPSEGGGTGNPVPPGSGEPKIQPDNPGTGFDWWRGDNNSVITCDYDLERGGWQCGDNFYPDAE